MHVVYVLACICSESANTAARYDTHPSDLLCLQHGKWSHVICAAKVVLSCVCRSLSNHHRIYIISY